MVELLKKNIFVRILYFGWTASGREKLRREFRWKQDRKKETKNAIYLRNEILKHEELSGQYSVETEILKNKTKAEMYNYAWTEKYSNMPVDVFEDMECSMKYVLHKGKKLYFPKNYDDETIIKGYRGLVLEQDDNSPHCYLNTKFDVVKGGGIFLDVGCAEAMTSLEIVDFVDKVILFEASDEWIEALKKTFEPYANKVSIIPKMCVDVIGEGKTTVDEELKKISIPSNSPIWIKMDVEGSELDVLNGCKMSISEQKNIHFACTTYHNQDDAEKISSFFMDYKFSVEYSDNWILFIYDTVGQKYPYFRHGLCFAERE